MTDACVTMYTTHSRARRRSLDEYVLSHVCVRHGPHRMCSMVFSMVFSVCVSKQTIFCLDTNTLQQTNTIDMCKLSKKTSNDTFICGTNLTHTICTNWWYFCWDYCGLRRRSYVGRDSLMYAKGIYRCRIYMWDMTHSCVSCHTY